MAAAGRAVTVATALPPCVIRRQIINPCILRFKVVISIQKHAPKGVLVLVAAYNGFQVNFLEQQQQECRGRGTPRTDSAGRCRSRSRDRVGSKRSRDGEDEQGALARTKRVSHNHSNPRPRVVLTIQHREHEVAAVAVIASLYGVADALSGLQQSELVHAIQYADLLQVGPATAEALQTLQTAATADAGLSIETLEKLAALAPWPNCLLALLPDITKHLSDSSNSPNALISNRQRQNLIQSVLLSVLGNLETTWQQQELQHLLLKLSLPAMSLLLSSDKLFVYSEDTVLYTACKFTASQAVSQRAAAINSLSVLIRVGQLSDFQLMLQSTPRDDFPQAGDVLRSHDNSIQRLVSLTRLGVSTAEVLAEVQRLLPTAPSSWSSGPRQIVVSKEIKLAWHLLVADLKAAVSRCHETKMAQVIFSMASSPLAGLEWKIAIMCRYIGTRHCVQINLLMPASSPSGIKGVFHKFDYAIQVPCKESLGVAGSAGPLTINEGWSLPNFFRLTMSGGWDEAAWAAKGLPTFGSFTIILSVSKVY